MAVRTDITFDWDSSPRIITVDAPSLEISMQDLYDTCRDIEPEQIDEPSIIDGAGKEPLGGNDYVGLTLTLNNAVLAFEARSGPAYAQCVAGGGNLVAVDVNGDPLATPIHPTAFTQVLFAASSSATLTVISTGSGLSAEQATQLLELYKLQGLALGLPMTVTPTLRTVDDIEQEITGDGETTTTVERQP